MSNSRHVKCINDDFLLGLILACIDRTTVCGFSRGHNGYRLIGWTELDPGILEICEV
jgi:hypothetical protein